MASIIPTETTSLLHGPSGILDQPPDFGHQSKKYNSIEEYSSIADGESIILKSDGDFDTTWRIESSLLFKYSAPLILTYLLQYSYNLVMVIVAGQLGAEELAAASLASMTANITGLCVFEGMATSLDTLTSQAYGSGRKKLVGLHVQRMWAMMLVAVIPIGAIWISSPWILQRLVPEPKLATLAGTFLRYYLIGVPGYAMFEAGKRFMQAQGNFTASLVVVMICAPLNILWNWIFVFHLDLGFRGAALAIATSNLLQPLVLLLYINLFARYTLECWPGLDTRKCFQNWGQMAQLSFPGILMVLSEWLAFDILTFTASYISTTALAAQSVLMSVAVTMYHIPMPVAVAASTRFGNLIGHGAVTAARKAWRIYYAVFIGIGIFDIVVLTSLRHVIARSFTDDVDVQYIIITTIPVVAAAQMFDAMACLVNGLLRGLGRQKVGGWVNLGVYYAWAIPLSLLLTFGPPKLGLLGLWVGPLSGLGIVTVIVTLYLKWSNWQMAVDEAKARGG
jgi:MATE family multidrug resistance protein